MPGELAGDSGPRPTPAASLGRRLASLAYESLLLGAVLLGSGFLLAPLVSPAANVPADSLLPLPAVPARMVTLGALFGVGALYFCWSWSDGRRTLPMQTWRLRLTGRNGRAVGRRSALIRYLGAWIGPAAALLTYAALRPAAEARYALWLIALNYAWAWVDRDRQFLHDRIAGTRIVRDRQ